MSVIQSTVPPNPSAPDPSKEMESLRKADDDLGSRIASLSLIRLGIVFIVVLLFGSGIKRQSDGSVQNLIQKINASPDQQDSPISTDPLGLYLYESARALPGFSSNQDEDDRRHDEVLEPLNASYIETFKVKVSILGTDLSFDLRTVILTLPLWLPLLQMYMHILREKRRVLRAVAASRALQLPADKTNALDQLLFAEPDGAYNAYPDVFTDRLFWFTVVVLLGMAAIILYPSKSVSLYGLGFIVLFVLSMTFYTRAYSGSVADRLREQSETLFNISIPRDLWSTLRQRLTHRASSLFQRLPVRPTLLTAAACIFLTLFLNTAVAGCDSSTIANLQTPASPNTSAPTPASTPQPSIPATPPAPANGKTKKRTSETSNSDSRPGYQLLTGAAVWAPCDWLLGMKYEHENRMGRTAYILLLVCAFFALPLTLIPALYQRTPVWLLTAARTTLVLVSLFLVCEFCNQLFLFGSWLALLAIFAGMLLWMFLRRHQATRRRLTREAIFIAIVPLLALDFMYLIENFKDLYGLVLLFFAAHTLTLGYAALEARRRASTRPSPAIP